MAVSSVFRSVRETAMGEQGRHCEEAFAGSLRNATPPILSRTPITEKWANYD
jgi:hypothetical protein